LDVEELRGLLSASRGIEKVMGDVLRALYLFSGALWLPELVLELEGLNATLGDTAPSSDEVEDAVKRLARKGYVTLRPGIRATMSAEGQRTVLVSIVRDSDLLKEVSMDPRVIRYRRIWEEVFREEGAT